MFCKLGLWQQLITIIFKSNPKKSYLQLLVLVVDRKHFLSVVRRAHVSATSFCIIIIIISTKEEKISQALFLLN